MVQWEAATRTESLAREPPELPLGSSLVEMDWGKLARFSGSGANRGQKLAELCSLNIKASSLGCGVVKESRIRLLPELPFHYPASTRQKKCFAETSPKKGSRLRRWRRVSRQPRDNPLQLNIDFLVLATAYSLGMKFSADCSRDRVRVNDYSLGRRGRETKRRTIKDKRCDSIVEPYLIAYDAGYAFSKNRHRAMSLSYDGDGSEDRQSEEVQSAYKRDNEVDEDLATSTNSALRYTEGQNDETDWSWVLQDKDGDPLAESISSLQTTQEVLESGKILFFVDASHALCFGDVCVLNQVWWFLTLLLSSHLRYLL
jgi:hypothetical protein